MSEKINELIKEDIFKNFYLISQVPHPSFKEEELSNYLYSWAKERNLEVYQDDFHNLVIKKPGVGDLSNKEPILLQAHIDMVCEKSPESNHDFEKDPIKWVIEDDFITTGKTTTLGADNGAGVAIIMSILESKDIKHPPIEALLTTAEEEDMSGALNFDETLISAKRGINLDNNVDDLIIMGSCGGMGVNMTLPMEKVSIPENFESYKIDVFGFLGGHSGTDIHRGRGNANIVSGRLLYELDKNIDYSLVGMNGGNFRLAIPRESEIIIAMDSKDEDILKNVISKFLEDIKNEYLSERDNIKIEFEKTKSSKRALSEKDKEKFIQMLILLPNNILELNSILGGVDSSNNVGEVKIEENEVLVVSEIRAATNSQREYTFNKISELSKLIGFSIESFAKYPGWKFNPDSKLEKDIQRIALKTYGNELKTSVEHCGLECGCICEKIPEMDIVSMGPNHDGLHSPRERLSISSMRNFNEFLIDIIENLF